VTILPHVIVSVQPQNATLAGTEQLRFAATVTGTNNQFVIWSVSGAGCGVAGVCGISIRAGCSRRLRPRPRPA